MGVGPGNNKKTLHVCLRQQAHAHTKKSTHSLSHTRTRHTHHTHTQVDLMDVGCGHNAPNVDEMRADMYSMMDAPAPGALDLKP